jgi:hypothetical protein
MTAARIEENRLAFLSAVLRSDGDKAVAALRRGLELFERHADPGEAAQKSAAQLRHSIRVWRKKNRLPRCADLRNLEQRIGRRLAALARVHTASLVSESSWRSALGLGPRRTAVLLATLTSLQLSVGCSHFCRRCNEWALPGVRKHFDFKTVKSLIAAAYETGNHDFCLYCASDPLDWRDGEHDLHDVLAFLEESGIRLRYGLLTKVPKGADGLVVKLATRGADLAVSLTSANRERVRRLEAILGTKLEVQHDFEDLLIPAGRDEDFDTVKSSITDSYGTEITPEGAFLVIPTFTSALYPTGQCRLPVTPDTPWFLRRQTGRQALLVDYFKPLAIVDPHGEPLTLDHLLDVQVETVLLDTGHHDATPPGMSDLATFFQTFDREAVRRRRRMIPAVVKRYRKLLLEDVSPPDREGFRHVVRDYVRSCRERRNRHLRQAAFTYLLAAVQSYSRRNPDRTVLLRHLRGHIPPLVLDAAAIEAGIHSENGTAHALFQGLTSWLLEDPDAPGVAQFVEEHPARFDRVTGRYIPFSE